MFVYLFTTLQSIFSLINILFVLFTLILYWYKNNVYTELFFILNKLVFVIWNLTKKLNTFTVTITNVK